MKLHKGTIVGLKQSKRLIGWFYPIFEYTDKDGQKKQYMRNSGMEITPFSKHKKYVILKRGSSTCERTEDELLSMLYSPAMLTKPFMLLFVIPNTIFLLLLSSIIPIAVTQLLKAFKIGKMRKATRNNQPIEGKIVGYRQGHRDLDKNETDIWCKPIIEYQYKNQTYYHASRIYRHGADWNAIGGACNVYLDAKSRRVFDNFEATAPFYWWFYQQIAIPMHTIKRCVAKALKHFRNNAQKSDKPTKGDAIPLRPQLRTLYYSPQKGM